MILEHFLLSYGYLILFIGTFLEGETVLIIAGFLANQGELSLLLVIIVAALGAFAGDQFFFIIGRLNGKKTVQKYEIVHKQFRKINSLLEKYDVSFLIGFRFVYGIRVITPLIIGASNIKTRRFLVLNAIGSILWAIVVGGMGYLFGETLSAILGRIKHIEFEVIVFLAVIGIIVGIIRFLRIRYELNKKAQISEIITVPINSYS